MSKYILNYDRRILEVDIPSEDIINIIEPNNYKPKFLNEKDIVLNALSNPIDSPLIEELFIKGEEVCIMVNDVTRLTKSEVFIPLLIEELNKVGIRDKDITILFANGLHREMTKEEMITIIGSDIYNRVNITQHNGINADFEFVGRTSLGNDVYVNKIVLEANKLILTGGIIMHHLAGYGGGRKNIIPGCAKQSTIYFNHKLMVDPRVTAGRTEDNPLHKDLMEASEFINPDFLLNVILDHEGKIAGAVAGNWKTAHEEGCKIADELYKVQIEEQADLVIASAGGFPKDIDLRQSKKSYYNAAHAVKPGGVMICFVACAEGISREGDPFELWLEKYDTFNEVKEALIENFNLGGLNAFRTREIQDNLRLILITDLDTKKLNSLKIEAYPPEQAQKIINKVREELGGNPKIILMPHAGLTLPYKK